MTTCARCGRDIPSAVAVCPYCGERNDAATAGSGAYQLIGDAVLAPAPPARDASRTFAATAYPAVSAEEASWDVDWPESPSSSLSDEQQPQQPQQPQQTPTSLVGGHLTLSSASTSGALSEGSQYEFELTGGDIIIGRSPGCDISLPDDPLASRRHTVLSFKEPTGSYTVADLGSSNGTYLNGVEVHDETELRDGDVITVGRHALLVSASPSREHALPIEARVTGPIALLPSEDTDPHLAVVVSAAASAADEAAPADALWAADAPAIAPGGEESPFFQDNSQEIAAPPEGAPASPMAAGTLSGGLQQHDLDALQTQLTELIGGLRQQAEADAAVQERLRRALVDVRHTLETALATQLEPGAQAFSARVDTLADLARKTTENPRHLDFVLSLSERAEELVIVLEAVQKLQAGGGPLGALQSLYARVTRELE